MEADAGSSPQVNSHADGYRLPTEAEWEFAQRGGTTTSHFWGDDEREIGDYAWYSGNAGDQTHPIAEKKPNLNGLFDRAGNVWEWTGDLYITTPLGGVDPTGPKSGSGRVIRGGSYHDDAQYLRSAHRNYSFPGGRGRDLGFRLARTLMQRL